MKNNKHIIRLVMSLLALLAAGCTERIDISGGAGEPMIVMWGTVSEENSKSFVRIQTTGDYFEQGSYDTPIKDAEVMLHSSKGYSFRLVNDNVNHSGQYQTPYEIIPEAGEVFTLEVDIDEASDHPGGSFTITTATPPPVEFDSIEIRLEPVALGIKGYNIYLHGQDPPGDNYYVFSMKVNTVRQMIYLTQYITLSDALFDGQYANELVTTCFQKKDKEILGSSIRIIYLSPGDVVELSIYNVEKGYHDFLVQCKSEKNGSNPFLGGPASNIVSNIPGGVGYFTSYCITTLTTVVPGAEDDGGE